VGGGRRGCRGRLEGFRLRRAKQCPCGATQCSAMQGSATAPEGSGGMHGCSLVQVPPCSTTTTSSAVSGMVCGLVCQSSRFAQCHCCISCHVIAGAQSRGCCFACATALLCVHFVIEPNTSASGLRLVGHAAAGATNMQLSNSLAIRDCQRGGRPHQSHGCLPWDNWHCLPDGEALSQPIRLDFHNFDL
jgi:hypothetical protein